MTEPTNAELVRRMEDIARQLADLVSQLRTDYVRADVYTAQSNAMRDDIKDVRDRQDRSDQRQDRADQQRAADRRLILTTFIAPIVTALIVLYVTTQAGGHT